LALALDVTSPEQVAQAFRDLRLAYGGLDILVSHAGIALVGAIHELPLDQWQRSLDINTTGHFLVAGEAVRLMRDQGMGGSIVFIGTKNVPSPGKDFGAYSASKAAEVQLARVLAIENGDQGIRVNVVNPDAVFEGSTLWSTELKEQRAKAHGIAVEELEDFYRQRNLLKERVTGDDVAQAVLFLAGPRSSKTTGTMLPVDAGLSDAFPR
jgi:NAD(P)-dependent dehydrogenase (short-subunit alcohol dehydrogenase family)